MTRILVILSVVGILAAFGWYGFIAPPNRVEATASAVEVKEVRISQFPCNSCRSGPSVGVVVND